MRLYEVNAQDGEPPITFGTKREAVAEARTAAREYAPEGTIVEVDEITLVKIDKALIVRLVNSEGGYVVARRTVFTIPTKRTNLDHLKES